MKPEELARHLDQATAKDWLRTCQTAPEEIVESTGLRVQNIRNGAWAVTMPKQEHYPINGPVGVGIFEPASEPLIDELMRFYREVDREFGIGITPTTLPLDLATWLIQRGFTISRRIPLLYRSVSQPSVPSATLPDGLRIEQVGRDQAELWRDTFGSMWVWYLAVWQAALIGQPGRFHYLVLDEKTPVAVSQMSTIDGVGFLHFSAVRKEYQGRGIQRALIAQRIEDAAKGGCEWVTSTADEDTPQEPGYSFRNLFACGFQLLHYSQGYDAPQKSSPVPSRD